MKKAVYLTVAALFMALQALPAFAAPVVFTVSATVPSSTGVNVLASSVNSATGAWTAAGTALSMDPLVFDTTNNIYMPNHYFAIDVGSVSGTGNVDVVATYADSGNPNGSGHGLGWKSTATFVKVTGTTEALLTSHPKKMLKDVVNEHVLPAEISGGWLRLYVGLVTTPGTPSGSEAFSKADAGGSYSGTLTITATIV